MSLPAIPAELRSLLEQLPEPHILFTPDYRIVFANRAYRDSHGSGRALLGQTCYHVSHHYDAPCDQSGESCPLARSRESGQRERVLHLHHTPHGEEYVDIELIPLRNAHGEISWFVERMTPLPSARRHGNDDLIGRAPAFVRMLEQISRVAPSDATVLLQGESGSGKELVAQAIHRASKRANRPFVVVDCSGLPETLFESALFGHERGAFTGAVSRQIGLIEAAQGGTLFLDEVGDIPLTLQVKLLRLLETGAFRRVGSVEPRHADVRVISATHRPLRQMVADGRFRQDLFFRLNTFPIALPPLRARREDIPALADALLERVAPSRGLRLSPAALARLASLPFPGNVRELRNLLERASLLCDGPRIEPEHLDDPLDSPWLAPADTPPAATAPSANSPASRKALAAQLGISERTLYRRLKAGWRP